MDIKEDAEYKRFFVVIVRVNEEFFRLDTAVIIRATLKYIK